MYIHILYLHILLTCIFAGALCRVEEEMYKEWLAQVDEACSFNLAQPLLERDPETNLIKVNFDPQVKSDLYIDQVSCLIAPSGGIS